MALAFFKWVTYTAISSSGGPELVLGTWVHGFERAHDPHAPLPAPAPQLHRRLGDLLAAQSRRPFPPGPRHLGDGPPHIGRKPQFEKVWRALFSFLFVPGQDRLLAEAHIPAMEPEALAERRMAPAFRHRGLPVGGADKVARPPLQGQAQPRARRHADERMVAFASAFVRVVTEGGILLMTVTGVGVASQSAMKCSGRAA